MKHCMYVNILYVVIIVLFLSGVADADDELVQRFQREYPSAAKRLEKKLEQVRGRFSIQDKPMSKKTGGYREFWFDHDYQKAKTLTSISGSKSLKWVETIDCLGPRSGFSIFRKSNSKDYHVIKLHRDKLYGTLMNTTVRLANCSFCVFGYPLYKQLNNNNFHLKSVEKMDFDDHDCVKVEYQAGSPGTINLGTVVLDPSRDWAIVSCEERFEFMKFGSVAWKPHYDDSNFPIPIKVEDKDINNNWSTVFFKDVHFEGTPEAEFRMPFYGLPDIADDDSGDTFFDRYAKYAIPIVVAIVLAYLFKRSARRLNRSPAG